MPQLLRLDKEDTLLVISFMQQRVSEMSEQAEKPKRQGLVSALSQIREMVKDSGKTFQLLRGIPSVPLPPARLGDGRKGNGY